jgi:glycosyltransferase involved in cell wall biosynthesis
VRVSPPEVQSKAFALMTAARNEGSFIERTLRSISEQTVLPSLWVIVSDGSTDDTVPIVEAYCRAHDFIQIINVERPGERDFGSKVEALDRAAVVLSSFSHAFVGNVDADVSLPTDYFATLLRRFAADERLGIAGGWVHEDYGRGFQSRPFNAESSVSHAAQLVRRQCYERIGGYARLPYGGEDTCAAIKAEMNGWLVRSYQDLPIFHHRRTASAGGLWRSRFRMGLADWSLGYAPYYEVLKCARRIAEPPWGIGSVLRLGGYASGVLGTQARPVPAEFVRFVRQTQRKRFSPWSTARRSGFSDARQ